VHEVGIFLHRVVIVEIELQHQAVGRELPADPLQRAHLVGRAPARLADVDHLGRAFGRCPSQFRLEARGPNAVGGRDVLAPGERVSQGQDPADAGRARHRLVHRAKPEHVVPGHPVVPLVPHPDLDLGRAAKALLERGEVQHALEERADHRQGGAERHRALQGRD
jgi:hypothetical protein